MNEKEFLAARFEEHRPHLRAVSYRILGSFSDADDAVQEAWVRLNRSDAAAVENLGGWLTTVVARVCLNVLRSRETRREEPLGVHVPDPVVSSTLGADPEQEALLADSVGLALLVALQTLSPAERLAFVLHDMFAVPFEEIAPTRWPRLSHRPVGCRGAGGPQGSLNTTAPCVRSGSRGWTLPGSWRSDRTCLARAWTRSALSRCCSGGFDARPHPTQRRRRFRGRQQGWRRSPRAD